MSELFFYWRLPADAVPAAQAALRAWHRGLDAAGTALLPRLYVRHASESGGPSTLMEVYAAPEAWRERLVSEGDALTARWRSGPRHLEDFDELT